ISPLSTSLLSLKKVLAHQSMILSWTLPVSSMLQLSRRCYRVSARTLRASFCEDYLVKIPTFELLHTLHRHLIHSLRLLHSHVAKGLGILLCQNLILLLQSMR
ncbi:hypothetical protein C8J56DRAFT_908529, partial [Mycena floridula]